MFDRFVELDIRDFAVVDRLAQAARDHGFKISPPYISTACSIYLIGGEYFPFSAKGRLL